MPSQAAVPCELVLASETGELRIESVSPVRDAVPSIVDVAPAASWDEREAHDLYGVRFDGHEPLRPLVEITTSTLLAGPCRCRAETRTR